MVFRNYPIQNGFSKPSRNTAVCYCRILNHLAQPCQCDIGRFVYRRNDDIRRYYAMRRYILYYSPYELPTVVKHSNIFFIYYLRPTTSMQALFELHVLLFLRFPLRYT